MKKIILTTGLAVLLSLGANAQTPKFTPGRLVVLRIGDGLPDTGGTNKISDWNFKQNPDFIDEFDPNLANATVPTYSMAFPTNGANALWNNGNAGSEACSLGRSADCSILTYSAYTGDILSQPGTPSALPYHRGISVIDAFGTNQLVYVGDAWYGIATGKTNPRGVVSDGTNNFWGSGNVVGTLYFNPGANDGQPIAIQNFTSTRAVKIINDTVYTTIIGKDSLNTYPCGIYSFVDFNSNPDPMPTAFAGFHLVVPAAAQFTNISGFYMNPQGTIAYMADLVWGVQKYVKSGGTWQFACNFNVQGYEQTSGGLVITNDSKNSYGGCFDVVADFSGTNPVIYATTEDYSFYSGNANSNRIVRIVDTNNSISGFTITNFTVVAQAKGTNVGFRAIEFTPDLRPIIMSAPDDLSVVAGSPATFSITASESGAASAYSPIAYQWLQNGTNLVGQTDASFTLNSPALSDSGNIYQCIVTNQFGSVTSTPPANLTVTTVAVAPSVSGSVQNLTNAVGESLGITVKASGTSPLSYQWYAGGVPLTDANEFGGTATRTLSIGGAQFGVDNTNYYCVVTNIAGATSNLIASLTLVFTPPVISAQPGSTIVLSNTAAQFSVNAFGVSMAYQWYTSNKVAVAEATASTLTINPAITNQGYFVVVTNRGGAVTSSVATATVLLPPPHSFVAYTNAGQIYIQNFDSLPVVTNGTFNTGNPELLNQIGSANAVTYSLDDPFDFAYPVLASGGVGGLGLTNTMKGWYGWGAIASKLGAHQGDQSTGGIIDYGTLSTNVNIGGTNRALGLQSTSTTGSSAMGVKLINNTTNTLSYVTLKYTGEIWRNQPRSNSLVFSYYIDLTGTNAFSPTNATATFVPGMDVNFNTNAAGLLVLDGTQPSNQISLAVTNLAIGNWPTNAALWLVWQQLDSQGSAQGIAIDNLNFSATNQLVSTGPILPITITPDSMHFVGSGASATAQFSFTNVPGLSFSILATNNVTTPKAAWPVIGTAVENPANSGNYQFTDPNPATNSTRFYMLRQP